MTQTQGGSEVEALCRLAGVSRAGYYRNGEEKENPEEEMDLRAAIHEIVLEHKRRYGSPRVTRELKRRGMRLNHKRVERLMREDNLLALRDRKFKIVTTDSRHPFEAYWNLAARMTLTGIDQLWVADITYIRLREEFVYLAVVLDRFSRRAVGWELDCGLSSTLAIRALQAAIDRRRPRPGLVHHSDRGVQYACGEYAALLKAHGIDPSMSRAGNPYDNAFCESFMKTLKAEEIRTRQYRDMGDLRSHLEEFIDDYYNCRRMHSALGYLTPVEFEAQAQNNGIPAGAGVSFFRHGEIYRSDVCEGRSEEPESPGSPDRHRLDESPSGYSSTSCSPAELVSASPPNRQSGQPKPDVST